MTTTAIYRAVPSVDLLHGGAQLAELSLLATRARNAAVLASRGDALDDLDRLALEQMSGMLNAAAKSLEFFESSGTRGASPSGALAARVDATIDAVVTLDTPDTKASVARLTTLALAAQQVLNEDQENTTSDADLAGFLQRLATATAKQLGHVGEDNPNF